VTFKEVLLSLRSIGARGHQISSGDDGVEASDALVTPLPVTPASDKVSNQDEDDQQGKSDSDGNGNNVVRHVITIHGSLKKKMNKK